MYLKDYFDSFAGYRGGEVPKQIPGVAPRPRFPGMLWPTGPISPMSITPQEPRAQTHRRVDDSGLIEADPVSMTIRVLAPCFFREMYSACQDLFDEPEMMQYSTPIAAIGASQGNAFWKWEAINGWQFEGLDQVDFRCYADKEQPPQPHLTRARIVYESSDGSERYEHGDEMVNLIPGIKAKVQPDVYLGSTPKKNLCYITYIEDNGVVMKQPFESKEEMVLHDFYDENEGVYYYLPDPSNEDDRRLVHSEHDQVALYENEYNRSHWIWKGILHRLEGPAFHCTRPSAGSEYHAFGFWLDAEVDDPIDFLSRNFAYLKRLQDYLEDHNVLPSEFDGIWTLQSWDNLMVSLSRGHFYWTQGGRAIDLFDDVPGFEEERVAGGLGAALGIAALSAAALATLKSKAKTKKTQQVKQEQTQEV